mmetsp:Transcript_28103/g.43267  ORF Transcript_28103/g.43267 Transcript_28103/m.43267 type:complete len:287 (-) Transcript_28103:63-923(-)
MGGLDGFPDEGYVPNQNCEASDVEFDDDPDQYVMVPLEKLGKGYFDEDVGKLKDGINLQTKTYYSSVPRSADTSALTVPADHPLRAIAKVLEEAPPESTIRVYAYVWTCKYAIDLLLHYAAQYDLKIILNYDDRDRVEAAAKSLASGGAGKTYSVNRISAFLDHTDDNHSYAMFALTGCRVVDVTGSWISGSSMHEKCIITETKTVVGSYNLSYFARCKNYESVHVVDTVTKQCQDFDALWESLGDRDITQVYPNSFSDQVVRTRNMTKRKFREPVADEKKRRYQL